MYRRCTTPVTVCAQSVNAISKDDALRADMREVNKDLSYLASLEAEVHLLNGAVSKGGLCVR
jgi:hypothetical protein